MKISVSPSVFKKYPLSVGIIHIKNIDNSSHILESSHLLHEAEQLVRLTFNQKTVRNHHLIKPWTVAKEEFGKKAKHYQTSVEKLLRKVLERRSISTPTSVNNIINYISLKYIVPVSADDRHKLSGNLLFRIAESPVKKSLLKRLPAGHLYYQDKGGIIGTHLDSSHASRTKVSKSTVEAVIHFSILPPLNLTKMKPIVKETVALLRTFCGGKVKAYYLTENKKSIVI